ncbi:unnamed protein product [Peronospora effusa]|nr:unnamed protein product [Peronospora effusa]
MPLPEASTSTVMPRRAPPPPLPTSTSDPSPELEQIKTDTDTQPSSSKSKHRGFIRVIGGFFKRKCSDADDVTAPSDSEASQRRTSRWSRWSHRQSLPDASFEMTAIMTEPTSGVIQEITSPRPVDSDVNTVKTDKIEVTKLKPKPKLSFAKGTRSPSDPLEFDSSDESGTERSRISFLFFGGSDVDSTFQPTLRSSSLDNLHEQDIHPSLQAKMPLFLSVPLGGKMRRSGILPDPMEYEL